MHLVLRQHRTEFDRIGQIALVVALGGGDDRWGYEVVLRSRHLHHEAAAEQLAHQWLKYHVSGEILLQVIRGTHDRLDRATRALPDRVFKPVLLAGVEVET